jgi:Asp-tRNA(Asn)/Glu-tRNA(Gln) amidotransferase C subunit
MHNVGIKLNNVSLEMIDTQRNDSVVGELKREFNTIVETIEKHDLKTNKDVFSSKYCKNNFKKIDKIIFDRFGINARHILDEEGLYAVMPLKPINNNSIDRYIEDTYSNIKSMLDYFSTFLKDKKPEEFDSYQEDGLDLLKDWTKSMEEMDEILNKDGVRLDLKNARVYGLPKKANVYFLVNPIRCVKDFKLSGDMLAAIIMHEVGHAFTHIEYSHRMVRTTSVLMDTLNDSLNVDGENVRGSYKVAYETAFGEKITEDLSDKELTIKLIDKYTRSVLYMNDNNHSFTDSEQLADQFATRFELGLELSQALSLIERISKEDYERFKADRRNEQIVLLGIITVYMLVVLGPGGLVAPLLFFIMGIVIGALSELSYFLIYGDREAMATTYDDGKRRVKRIKNELVRQLRTLDLDKESTKTKVTEIEQIVGLVESMPEVEKSLMEKVAALFNGMKDRNNTIKLSKLTEQMIEDLQENDLHVASAKLSTRDV